MLQNGVHVDALTYSWDQFPGFQGTLGDMLKEARASFPGKKFDYVDLAYDPVRDPSGQFRWMDVPRSPNGWAPSARRRSTFRPTPSSTATS